MDSDIKKVLEIAFHPKAIAIVGASDNPNSSGYHYVRHCLDYGYPGHIYPVNPSKRSILSLKAYPDLSSISESVDYVICCLPASKVCGLLAECPTRGVKVVHLFTGRLGETGRQEAKELEAEILQEARRLGIRLIGPNCMGIYHPRQGIAFDYDFPKEAGTIGATFQSGGASSLLVRYGESHNLRFSKVISYGNALDLDESDFLSYLAQDDETKLIAAYFEGVRDGRKFIKALGDAARAKPVIAIKGGRSIAGTKAAASHTAAIAGSEVVWRTVFKKTGAIIARDLSELVDFLAAFSFLPRIGGNRVGIIGGGGGNSVMSADACEESGLIVPPLSPEIREQLKSRVPEIWDWLGNPIDTSTVVGTSIGIEEMIRMMALSPHFDFIIAILTEEAPFFEENWRALIRGETEGIIKVFKEQLKPVIAVVNSGEITSDRYQNWRWGFLAEQRAQLVAAHVPTYSTIAEAAKAVRQVIDYWQRKAES